MSLGALNATWDLGCRLARGDNNFFALWTRFDNQEWVLVSLDGTSVVAGPYTGPDFGVSYQTYTNDVTYDGTQFVAASTDWERLKLYAFDDATGAVSPPCDAMVRPGEFFFDPNASIASDGEHLYVGLAPAPAPTQWRLQKLNQLEPSP